VIPFMQDLRNYTLHRKLPSLGHSVAMTGVNTPFAQFESEVKLGTDPLLDWGGWTAASKKFLTENPESISLRPVVEHYTRASTSDPHSGQSDAILARCRGGAEATGESLADMGCSPHRLMRGS
jgi:hypothetical protein